VASSPGLNASNNGGFDPAIANQLTLQALTSALTQQQLNAAAARSQLANTANVLTLTVQLNNMAALKQLTGSSPLAVAAAETLMRAGDPSHFAGLNAAAGTPQG